MTKRILVTGSNGFVGTEVVRSLQRRGNQVFCAIRRAPVSETEIQIGAINGATDWAGLPSDLDCIVHLAGHHPGSGGGDEQFRLVNVDGTARLLDAALRANVRNFVFVSSIFAIVGNASSHVVDDSTAAEPTGAYGRSKLEAEQLVAAFGSADRSAISIRAPMVYGGAAKGNWRLLQKLAATGLPLPFGAVHNRRSMISVVNLADSIAASAALSNPQNNGAYAVSDDAAVGLADILRLLREGMSLPARLFPMPAALMKMPLSAVGMSDSLFGNLQIDNRRFRQVFGWTAPDASDEAIRQSGAAFLRSRQDA